MTRRHHLLYRAAVPLVSALALLLTGCGGAAVVPAAQLNGERIEGGTITYGHDQEPACIYGGWVQQAYLSRQVLDSLVSQTDDGDIVPWLATSWEVSEDRLTWTFHLKEGVSFTDGTRLDAQAVSDNFEYWMAGGNGTVQAYIEDYYQSSRAVDPLTVEVTLKAPYSPLLSVLSQAYFGIQSPTALKHRSDRENCEQPTGSGPFTVERWNRGESVIFARNADYNWAPANARHQGPAYVEKIVWKFLDDPTSRYGSLLSGESDVIYDVPSINFEAAKSQFEVQQYITPGRPVTLSLNTVQGPFTDVKVRKAFAYSADRRAAVESAFLGVVPYEPNGALSQSTPGYNAEVADDYRVNHAKANALLDEAGWTERNAEGVRVKNGKELEVEVVFGIGSMITPEGATVLQNIQSLVKPVGFKVTLVPVTHAALSAGTYSTPDSYDAMVGYWTSPTAGILYINYRQNLPESPNFSNTTFYNNPDLEQLILEANSTLDKTEQNRLYGQAQQIISNQAVAIGLYAQTTSLAISPALKDVWIEASQGEPVFHDAYFIR